MRINKLVIGMLLFLNLTSISTAATVVDQSYTVYGGGTILNPLAQTFTSGVSGVLRGIEVNLTSSVFYPDRAYTFQVTKALNGVPVDSPESVLATITGVASDFSSTLTTTLPYHYFDVSGFNVRVAEDEMLAFIFDTENGPIQVNGDMNGSTYEGGSAFSYSNGAWIEFTPFDSSADLNFQTYVTPVPLPGTSVFLLSGLLALYFSGKTNEDRPRFCDFGWPV